VWSHTNNADNCNMAAFKFQINNDFTVADFDIPPVLCAPATIQFVNNSRGDSFSWSFGDGGTSLEKNPIHTYNQRGVYEVTLIVQSTEEIWTMCKVADTMTRTILVLGNSSDTLPSLNTCPNVPIQIGLMLNTPNEVTVQWNPSTGLTNAHVTDPYATITDTIIYTLVISADGCSDTIIQQVNLIVINPNTPDTMHFCDYPQHLIIPELDQFKTIASWNRNFTDTIEVIQEPNQVSYLDIATFESRYIYFKQQEGTCYGIDSTWIDYTGIVIDLQVVSTTCPNFADGQMTAVITNVQSPSICYVYDPASQGDISFNVGDTTIQISGYNTGIYTLQINSSNGCNVTLPFVIPIDDTLKVSSVSRNNPCSTANAGYIAVNVSGGQPPYSVVWSNGDIGDTIRNLPVGSYICTITDAKGCEINDTIAIGVSDTLRLNVTNTINNCKNGCTAQATATVYGGIEPYTYQWTNGSVTSVAEELCVGSYNLVVTDSAGCVATKSLYIGYADMYSDISVTASRDSIFDGESVTLRVEPQLEGVTYQWTPATNLSNPHSPITVATLYETTTFYILISDGNGCDYLDSITIYVEVVVCNKPNIHVPNIFTPNDDGKNDVIFVSGENINRIKFMIFDRWGEKVFETEDVSKGWDGRYRGKMCQNGVYYYLLEVECEANRTYSTSGDITLIR